MFKNSADRVDANTLDYVDNIQIQHDIVKIDD